MNLVMDAFEIQSAERKARMIDYAAQCHKRGDMLGLQMYLDEMVKIDERLAAHREERERSVV